GGRRGGGGVRGPLRSLLSSSATMSPSCIRRCLELLLTPRIALLRLETEHPGPISIELVQQDARGDRCGGQRAKGVVEGQQRVGVRLDPQNVALDQVQNRRGSLEQIEYRPRRQLGLDPCADDAPSRRRLYRPSSG